ncbi:MAG TPA: hypothetical protein VGP72_03575 [Planctomycetota bacterium]
MSGVVTPNRFLLFRRSLLAGAACSCLIAVAFYGLWPRHTASATSVEPTKPGQWVPIRRGDFEVLCREEGELKPVKVTSLTFLRWGKISFLIPEGTYVKKGEKVVAMETKDLEEEVSQLQEDASAAERNLAQLEQNRDLEIKRLSVDMASVKDMDAFATLKEKDLISRPLDVDKEQATSMLEGARARLANAEADLVAYKPLADMGFGRGTDLAAKEVAVAKAKVELQRAEMKFQLTMAGATFTSVVTPIRSYDRDKAKLGRESAALDVKLKQIEVEDTTDALEVKIKAAQRSLAHTKRHISRHKVDLERSVLIAPHEGLVVYRTSDFRGMKKPEIGEWAGPWFSPVELPNYERMKVRTQVPESFINRIQARPPKTADGQAAGTALSPASKARVTIKTLPDKVYTAEVTWIDGWARDRNSKLSDADIKAQGLSGVRVFDVEVELEESDAERLREGFRATVDFPVEMHAGVLSIPVSAITDRNHAPHVLVKTSEGNQWQKVEIGVQSLDRVIVTSGIHDGDEIFVPAATSQENQPRKPKMPEEKVEGKETKKGRGGAGGGDGGGPPVGGGGRRGGGGSGGGPR